MMDKSSKNIINIINDVINGYDNIIVLMKMKRMSSSIEMMDSQYSLHIKNGEYTVTSVKMMELSLTIAFCFYIEIRYIILLY